MGNLAGIGGCRWHRRDRRGTRASLAPAGRAGRAVRPAPQPAQLRDPAGSGTGAANPGAELDLRLESEVLEARRDGEGVLLRSRGGDGATQRAFSRVLAASGRLPNLEELDLAHSGLALDSHGVPLFRPAHRCAAAIARYSLPATPAMSACCCMKRLTAGASPATTPAAFPRCGRACVIRRWRSLSPIRKSPPSARDCQTCPDGISRRAKFPSLTRAAAGSCCKTRACCGYMPSAAASASSVRK